MSDRYRPRHVTVEARRWDGTPEQAEELVAWMVKTFVYPQPAVFGYLAVDGGPVIHVRGPHNDWRVAYPGDWIIRLGPDEFDACDPETFAAIYEPVPAEEADDE